MKPVSIPLEFTKGDDASVHLLFTAGGTPFDLTGWTFSASVRPQADPNVAPIEDFVVTLGPGVGEMTLRLEEDFTSSLPRRAYWSLRAYHVGTDLVQTWLAGNVRIDYTAESDTTANEYTIDVGADDIEVVTAANVGPTGATGAQGAPGLQGVAGEGVPPGGTTGQSLVKATATDFDTEWSDVAGGSGGAPTDAPYLVTSANAGLSGEVVVGTTPGGELGGTWSAPTVDTTHAGSAHLALGNGATQAATGNHAHSGTYEPAGTVATHSADTTDVHGIADTSTLATTAYVSSTVNDLLASTPTAPNVKDYGAIADGTSHPLSERFATLGAAQAVYPHAVALTDEIDWAALQKAANLGTATFVPPGVYLVNRTVVLTSGASLWGRHVVGQQFITSGLTSIKQKNAANLDAVVANNEWYNNSTTLDEACGLYGLQIDGNKANQTGGLRHGFVNSSWKGWCENVTVINVAGFGLYATGIMKNGTTAHAGGVPEMRFHTCHVRGCDGAGIVVEHWSMSDGFITDCVVWECPYGIFLYQSAGWVIHGNHTYGIGYDGITALNMLYTRVSDNYSESFGQSIASGGTEARGIWGRVEVADAIAQVTGNNVHLLLSATGAGSVPVGLRIESSATGGTRAAVAISDNTMRHEHGGTPRAGSIGLKVLKGAGALLVSGLDSVSEIGWATGQSIGSGIVRQGFYTQDFGGTMYTDGWLVALQGTPAQVTLGALGTSGAAGLALGDIAAGTHVTWARGAGSPEGVLTGRVGSLYTRTDGGAGTTLYVKESGTGNTGWVVPAGGSGVTTADYLVGTAQAGLSAEIVVGTSPGGELGGTWASPTVDATHAGSAHTDFVAKSLVDAKGDLLAGTANDTVARMAVGADKSVLEADSTATPGVAWVSRPRFFDRWRTGGYYSIGAFGASGTTTTVTQSKLYLGPFLVAVSATFDRIGLSVTTAVAATTVRIGIYNGTGTGYPNALVLDAGTIDSSTTGFKEITISQTLTPAVYWIGCVAQGGAPGLRTMTGAWLPYVADTSGNVASTTGLMAYSQTGVTGALSAATPFTSTVTTETALPRVELRVA